MTAETRDASPLILIADDELFFSVRIESTLVKLGYRVNVAAKPEHAVALARSEPIGLVIVNFAARSFDAGHLVRSLKALDVPVTVLAFMPHKQMPELAPGAKAAGCDQIVANSALTMRLPELVAKRFGGAPVERPLGRVE